MKMLSGFLEPDSGRVSMDGVDLECHLKEVQSNIGYLPENLPVYPEMVVADYLDYVADLKGLSGTEKKNEIKRAVLATDITAKFLSPINTLSRGYKQRVGVAQAIIGQPKLLILDEPTNGLDPEQTQHMRDLIRDIAQDATVILSTHIMQEVDALCTRVLMLRNGTLAVDAQLSDLRQSNHIIVECSFPTENMDLFSQVEGVKGVVLLESETYRIELNVADSKNVVEELKTLSAHLARTLIDNQYALYRLVPEHRDLETLFQEVNEKFFSKEAMNHAA
jgi:ABC-2 type transport system ATP-binding protein